MSGELSLGWSGGPEGAQGPGGRGQKEQVWKQFHSPCSCQPRDAHSALSFSSGFHIGLLMSVWDGFYPTGRNKPFAAFWMELSAAKHSPLLKNCNNIPQPGPILLPPVWCLVLSPMLYFCSPCLFLPKLSGPYVWPLWKHVDTCMTVMIHHHDNPVYRSILMAMNTESASCSECNPIVLPWTVPVLCFI